MVLGVASSYNKYLALPEKFRGLMLGRSRSLSGLGGPKRFTMFAYGLLFEAEDVLVDAGRFLLAHCSGTLYFAAAE